MTSRSAAALLFDFGGTLDADGVAWKTRFARLWRAQVGDVEPDAFDRAFYDADDALVGSLAPSTTLTETVRRLADGLARRLPGRRRRRRGARRRPLPRRGVGPARRQRRAPGAAGRPNTGLGVVSNFYGNLAAVCAEAGLAPHLSAAIDSAAVGYVKPDARIFQAALDALGARAEDAVFIGDSVERDMAGARAAGLRHVLLAGGQRQDLPAGCCPDDRVIARLADLPEALA